MQGEEGNHQHLSVTLLLSRMAVPLKNKLRMKNGMLGKNRSDILAGKGETNKSHSTKLAQEVRYPEVGDQDDRNLALETRTYECLVAFHYPSRSPGRTYHPPLFPL